MTGGPGPVRPVHSNQTGCHPRLAAVVGRHLQSAYRRPIAAHTRTAFARVAPLLGAERPLVLDAGCGTGVSTARLAERFPEALVLGVDKSGHRLARQPSLPANAVLVHAELMDFWRLCRQTGVVLWRHYLLYPNPWPKAAQLGRRWYASPLLPTIVALGGRLEVRSNWPLYIEEFALALAQGGITALVEPVISVHPVSPFEAKYRRSGQTLWRCRAELAAVKTADSWSPALPPGRAG